MDKPTPEAQHTKRIPVYKKSEAHFNNPVIVIPFSKSRLVILVCLVMSRSMNVVPFVSVVALCVLGDDYATSSGVVVNKIKIQL